MRNLFTAIFLLCLSVQTFAAEMVPIGATFEARDSLNPGEEKSEDAQACIRGLTWPLANFKVRCEQRRDNGDMLVRFSSPVPSGNAQNDLVALEWYVARDESGAPIVAPAIVVVHESGKNMNAGRIFAKGLQKLGFHTFMLQLPYYGERRLGGGRPGADNLVQLIGQAVSDVRRARDAVAVLPLVDAKSISLQGTSLGGFISATTAGLDRGYNHVFLMLAGGDLYDVLQNGARELTQFRKELDKAGFDGDKLKALLAKIEPTRLAHRLDAEHTWLYSAQFDQVVPAKNSNLLAHTARLEASHHISLLGDHYTGIVFLPFILPHIAKQINSAPPMPADAK